MKDLIREIKLGNRNSFRALYDQYFEYTFRVATAITKNRTYAADAVQETFIRVYNNIGNFDEDKSFEPWLYKILINECNRLLKKQSKIIPISAYLENYEDASEENTHKFLEYEELYAAITELEDINRIPLVLKYLRGFTEAEVAKILDTNVNTIKSRLYKGRQRLKQILEKQSGGRNEQYE